MKAIVIIITSEQAKKWLEKNSGGGKGNRKISQRQLNFLTESILRGQWVLNGETIKIGKDGSIIDGQHRLMAIVRSGMSIESLVVFDCDPEAYNTIDKGRARTAGETFRNLAIVNWDRSAASTCVLKMLKTNVRSVVALSSDERIKIYQEHDAQFNYFSGNCRRLRPWGVSPSIELGVQVFLNHLGYSLIAIDSWFRDFAADRHDENQRLLTRALRNEKAALRRKSFNSWWVAGIIIKAFASSQAGLETKSLRFLFEESYA